LKTDLQDSSIWQSFVLAFCILFAVLFAPIAMENLGRVWGMLATLAGAGVILLVYVIRVKIFTGMKNKK
jgi:hypothetical protein